MYLVHTQGFHMHYLLEILTLKILSELLKNSFFTIFFLIAFMMSWGGDNLCC